jgi:hypothetical protein
MTTTDDQMAERRRELSNDLYFYLRRHVQSMATAAGAATIERPVWPGSLSTTTYAEPLAGLREAVTLQGSAGRVIEDYARYARTEGASWQEIGEALGVGEEAKERQRSAAELAYEQIVGIPDLWSQANMYWPCPACGQTVTDRGPTRVTRSTTSTVTLTAARAWRGKWPGGRPSRTAGRRPGRPSGTTERRPGDADQAAVRITRRGPGGGDGG